MNYCPCVKVRYLFFFFFVELNVAINFPSILYIFHIIWKYSSRPKHTLMNTNTDIENFQL